MHRKVPQGCRVLTFFSFVEWHAMKLDKCRDLVLVDLVLPRLYGCGLQDMAAHSACDFGGGKAERLALAKYRSVVWQGRVRNARLSDKELRDMGKCPMTPEEVGIMLAALGFSPRTHVYLASYTVSYH
jgi:hypothetical protein